MTGETPDASTVLVKSNDTFTGSTGCGDSKSRFFAVTWHRAEVKTSVASPVCATNRCPVPTFRPRDTLVSTACGISATFCPATGITLLSDAPILFIIVTKVILFNKTSVPRGPSTEFNYQNELINFPKNRTESEILRGKGSSGNLSQTRRGRPRHDGDQVISNIWRVLINGISYCSASLRALVCRPIKQIRTFSFVAGRVIVISSRYREITKFCHERISDGVPPKKETRFDRTRSEMCHRKEVD